MTESTLAYSTTTGDILPAVAQGIWYSNCYSGGDSSLLSNDEWHALEDAGWTVEWLPEGRRLNDREAEQAYLPNVDIDTAVSRWEAVVKVRDAYDEGCTCCGRPHIFYPGGPDDEDD